MDPKTRILVAREAYLAELKAVVEAILPGECDEELFQLLYPILARESGRSDANLAELLHSTQSTANRWKKSKGCPSVLSRGPALKILCDTL